MNEKIHTDRHNIAIRFKEYLDKMIESGEIVPDFIYSFVEQLIDKEKDLEEVKKMSLTDTELVDWLCDHAIVIGYIDDEGTSHYDKVEGSDICFRDMVVEAIVINSKNKGE